MMFDDEESAKAAAETYKTPWLKKAILCLASVFLLFRSQASVVIIDNETGYVKAIVGGRGERKPA